MRRRWGTSPRQHSRRTCCLRFTRARSSIVAGVGGILVQILSAPVALLVDAASFLGSAVFLNSIRPVEPPTEHPAPGHLSAGARFIWHTPMLRASLLATATINLFNFVFFALFFL